VGIEQKKGATALIRPKRLTLITNRYGCSRESRNNWEPLGLDTQFIEGDADAVGMDGPQHIAYPSRPVQIIWATLLVVCPLYIRPQLRVTSASASLAILDVIVEIAVSLFGYTEEGS
jgi:hypothetical protein